MDDSCFITYISELYDEGEGWTIRLKSDFCFDMLCLYVDKN